jgi:hypothetical protein
MYNESYYYEDDDDDDHQKDVMIIEYDNEE